jgi:hypothetical protein
MFETRGPYFTLSANHIPLLRSMYPLPVSACQRVSIDPTSYLEDSPRSGQLRPTISGSDLQSVSPVTRTNQHKQASGVPSVGEILTDFSLDTILPAEEGV